MSYRLRYQPKALVSESRPDFKSREYRASPETAKNVRRNYKPDYQIVLEAQASTYDQDKEEPEQRRKDLPEVNLAPASETKAANTTSKPVATSEAKANTT
jgi:hypothetical protein